MKEQLGITTANIHVWYSFFFSFFFFLMVLGIETRALCLLGKHSTTFATHPALFGLVIFLRSGLALCLDLPELWSYVYCSLGR
jgi:hypothetical protein